ncbi:FAD:protein FMN transferase [Curtobacterium citreum]|uniref:FAD:protein FMN transferase n=1 Tax=Curtobacterium citreum TaxID=2036 RepID=UPI002543FA2D|nr:FAD:protein FMN transferase [Curtobacterium citreum]WIJ46750.1 FAD:protein FMN transferase [Curtobacterium citreum]
MSRVDGSAADTVVRTFETMGTVVSLRGADAPTALAVRDVFVAYDRRYSLYDPDSALSRIAAGTLRLAAAPQDVRDTYALALDWRERTHGAFTPHRPDGVLDLSGVVKALAIRDAGAVLDAVSRAGSTDWMLAVGGDVLASGTQGDDPWQVGVVDPLDRTRVVGVVPLGDDRRAVATSGTAERGEHVWRRAEPVFRQVTVVASDIVTADVLATAVLAGDEHDLASVTEDGSVDVLAFGVDGRVWATPGASAYVTAAAA